VPCWTRTADRPGRVVRSRDVRQRQSSSKSLSTYISNPNPACRFNSKKRFQKTALHTLPAVAPRIICSCCTYVWLTLGDSVFILFEKHVRRVRLLWEFSILLFSGIWKSISLQHASLEIADPSYMHFTSKPYVGVGRRAFSSP